MNLGQTMLTLGMFLLLIMTVISADRMLMENSSAQLQTQAWSGSAPIASSLLEEIMGKPFDQNVVVDTTKASWRQDTTGTKVTSATGTYPNCLTVSGDANRWGVRRLITLPDSSYNGNFHSIVGLKDIDDYDGYVRIIPFSSTSNFIVNVKVYYVSPTAPDVFTTTRQFLKKVEMSIQLSPDTSKVIYSALGTY